MSIGVDKFMNSGGLDAGGGQASAYAQGGTNRADFSKTFGNSGGLNWWFVLAVVVALLAYWLWKK